MSDVIEKPRRKASLKQQVRKVLDDVAAETGATVVHNAKVSKKAAVGKKPKSAGVIVEARKTDDQVEAFTPREMGIAADHLRQLVERIERLEDEKRALADDIKDVYGEAKGSGFDVKIIRKVIALRKKDHAERKEEEAILELYLEALGMA